MHLALASKNPTFALRLNKG